MKIHKSWLGWSICVLFLVVGVWMTNETISCINWGDQQGGMAGLGCLALAIPSAPWFLLSPSRAPLNTPAGSITFIFIYIGIAINSFIIYFIGAFIEKGVRALFALIPKRFRIYVAIALIMLILFGAEAMYIGYIS